MKDAQNIESFKLLLQQCPRIPWHFHNHDYHHIVFTFLQAVISSRFPIPQCSPIKDWITERTWDAMMRRKQLKKQLIMHRKSANTIITYVAFRVLGCHCGEIITECIPCGVL